MLHLQNRRLVPGVRKTVASSEDGDRTPRPAQSCQTFDTSSVRNRIVPVRLQRHYPSNTLASASTTDSDISSEREEQHWAEKRFPIDGYDQVPHTQLHIVAVLIDARMTRVFHSREAQMVRLAL